MPRSRKRTTSKGSWSSDLLQSAISVIKEGRSVHKVAQQFNIPYSTLKKRYRLAVDNDANYSRPPLLGRKPVFTNEQEQTLVNHLLEMSNMFYGLTSNQLCKICYQMAETVGVEHRFNTEKKVAGKDWFLGFMRRHPELSTRKPEATSINRILGFNKAEVTRFFNNLEAVMEKFKFEPQNIFNMDETGFSTVHEPEKIIAPRGQKRVGAVTSWERGKNVTAICAMSATGTFVPPLFIFPRQRHSPQLERDGPPGAVYTCSHNGWTNEQIFLTWLQHFIKVTSPSVEKQVLLIMDNHNSHATLEAFEMARKNHITMLSIPPHSSHRLQPLDVTFFGPLKTAYSRECDLYLKSRNLVKITPYEIAGLFNKAYSKVASLDKGTNGFKATGIFPMNPAVFSDEDFIPTSHTSDEPPNANAPEPVATSQISEHSLTHLPQQRDSPLPSTSFATLLDGLSPRPNIINKPTTKITNKQHSEVLTSTPMKEVFAEKKKKRLDKERRKSTKKIPNKKTKGSIVKIKKQDSKKKIKRASRRLFQDNSSSSTEESLNEETLCDNNSEYSEDENECVICLDVSKNNELWYRCRACGKWSHSECSGCDNPDDYICAFCLD